MDMKVLLFALLTSVSSAATPFDSCTLDKEEADNGFKYKECGTKCFCHPTEEACLKVKQKSGDDILKCSTQRKLTGMKTVKVIIIPLCCTGFLITAFAIMAKHFIVIFKNKVVYDTALAVLCLVQTFLSILLVFSPIWKFALYSALIAITVFYMMKVKVHCKWVLLAIATLQLFNLLATTGAYDTSGTFVPFGLLSADNVKSWKTGVLDMDLDTDCSNYYKNFFDLDTVEKKAEGADPMKEKDGYCTESWLAAVTSFIAMQAMLQLIMLMLTLQRLGAKLSKQELPKFLSEP